jgi:hypothetical protein
MNETLTLRFSQPKGAIVDLIEDRLCINSISDSYRVLLKVANSEVKSDCSANNFSYQNSRSPGIEIEGIDLPVIIKTERVVRGSLMIVGQDPLRKAKDFDCNQEFCDKKLIIGTPYALHSPAYREGRMSDYWKIVSGLVDEGWEVLLTDIHKDFVNSNTEQNQRYRKPAYNKLVMRDREIFDTEVKEYQPNHVVCFGVRAEAFIRRHFMNLVKTEHPSPRNHNLNGIQSKAQWILDDIRKKLSLAGSMIRGA